MMRAALQRAAAVLSACHGRSERVCSTGLFFHPFLHHSVRVCLLIARRRHSVKGPFDTCLQVELLAYMTDDNRMARGCIDGQRTSWCSAVAATATATTDHRCTQTVAH